MHRNQQVTRYLQELQHSSIQIHRDLRPGITVKRRRGPRLGLDSRSSIPLYQFEIGYCSSNLVGVVVILLYRYAAMLI